MEEIDYCCKALQQSIQDGFVNENANEEHLCLEAIEYSMNDGAPSMEAKFIPINNCPFCGIKLSEVI